MFDIEKYYEASTTDEAVALMAEHPSARLVCGGSDMLIKIREGKLAGSELIAIRGITEIDGVTIADSGDIVIGAATVFSHITDSPIIMEHIPMLGNAVDQAGGPQLRNIGTIGGNICNGAVSADSVPSLFSLDALLLLKSADGSRTVPINGFYLGPGRVALQAGEMLTHVIIQKENYMGWRGHYIKYSMRKAMDIATLSCAVAVKTSGDVLDDIRITFGVAAPTPLRCANTENKLKGLSIGYDLYRAIEDGVREEINPRDSWRASKVFRLQIGGEIAKRALMAALAGGEK